MLASACSSVATLMGMETRSLSHSRSSEPLSSVKSENKKVMRSRCGADRMGLLVMDEAFDCWDQGKNTYDYARFFNQWSKTDIGALVVCGIAGQHIQNC